MKNKYKKIALAIFLSVQPVKAMSPSMLFASLGIGTGTTASFVATEWVSKKDRLLGLLTGVWSFGLTFVISQRLLDQTPEWQLAKATYPLFDKRMKDILFKDFESDKEKNDYIKNCFSSYEYPLVQCVQELFGLKCAVMSTQNVCKRLGDDRAYENYILLNKIDLPAYKEKIDSCFAQIKKSEEYLEQLEMYQTGESTREAKRINEKYRKSLRKKALSNISDFLNKSWNFLLLLTVLDENRSRPAIKKNYVYMKMVMDRAE